MHPSQIVLLSTTAVFSGLLVTAYVSARPSLSDFGNVPSFLHTEMLICAAVGFLMLVSLLVYFSFAQIDPSIAWTLVGCTVAYFGISLAFFPMARAAMRGSIPKSVVRAALIVACLPLVVIACISILYSHTSLWIEVIVGMLGVLPALHGIINDAMLYGASLHAFFKSASAFSRFPLACSSATLVAATSDSESEP